MCTFKEVQQAFGPVVDGELRIIIKRRDGTRLVAKGDIDDTVSKKIIKLVEKNTEYAER